MGTEFPFGMWRKAWNLIEAEATIPCVCVLKATGLYIFKWLMLCYVNFPSLQKQTTMLIILQA